MNIKWTNQLYLQIAKVSALAYLLLFQAWTNAPDYPVGVLKEEYLPVGIFHLLPGPISSAHFHTITLLWPFFLIGAFFPRITKVCLLGSFILGSYVLGYSYNFGRVFHGTSLSLQILLVLAVGWPRFKSSFAEKERRAALVLKFGQLVICLSYFSSGVTKFLKSGLSWGLSDNLSIILHTQAMTTPFQDWLLALPPVFLSTIALLVLFVELTSLLPFLFSRLSPFYILAWSAFHVAVYFSLGGHSTFFSHFFMYPFFLRSISRRQSDSVIH